MILVLRSLRYGDAIALEQIEDDIKPRMGNVEGCAVLPRRELKHVGAFVARAKRPKQTFFRIAATRVI